MSRDADVTRLLLELREGNQEALNDLLPIVYDQLRRIAHRQLGEEHTGHTLNTIDLVHEAFLKLVDLDRIRWQNRAQFFAIAARVMRQILVDYAVQRMAQKRGGGHARVPLSEEMLPSSPSAPGSGRDLEELIDLDEALVRLEKMDERQCRVVECRFFAGLDVTETAAALDVSPATVKRDWSVARAWLNQELSA